MTNQVQLDQLRQSYLELRERKSRIRSEVKERHRQKIQEEIDAEILLAERDFSVQFVNVRNQGASRRDLVNVIRDGSADTFRKYVELGGGHIRGYDAPADYGTHEPRTKLTGVEVVSIPNNLFLLTVDAAGRAVEPLEVTVKFDDNGVIIFPTNMQEFPILRDEMGYDLKHNQRKAREIIEAFGIEQEVF